MTARPASDEESPPILAPDPDQNRSGRLRKSDRTRQRILDAAAAVFREQGYGARLSDVAERAGLQTGSLYYHFDSRDALVSEILRIGLGTAWSYVRRAVDELPADATPRQRLEAAVRAHTLTVLQISDYSAAQTRILHQAPDHLARQWRREQRAYGEYWNGLIEELRTSGELRPGADGFVARMLAFGAMNWTTEWFAATRGDAAHVADEAAAFILGGLVVR